MSLKLYNVTFMDALETLLTPRVPYSAGDGEDKEIERICLSSSIRGCMQAIGPAGRFIAKGARFVVREANIVDFENVLNPVQLFLSGKVPDAMETMEYWYLRKLPVTVRLYEIIDYAQEYEIAWSCIEMQDLLSILSKYTSHKFSQPTSKQIYLHAMQVLDSDSIDAVWDDIVELPWAQCIRITKLRVLDKRAETVLDL